MADEGLLVWILSWKRRTVPAGVDVIVSRGSESLGNDVKVNYRL